MSTHKSFCWLSTVQILIGICLVLTPTSGIADPTAGDATLGKGLTGVGAQVIEQQVSPGEAWKLIKAGALVVDVRSAEEFATGHLEQALNIPHTDVGAKLGAFGSDKNKQIVLYCRSGRRSGIAKEELKAAGFTNVVNAGGYAELKAAQAGH